MSFKFNQENQKYFEKLLQRYPEKEGLTLPCLWIIQYQEGWISQEAMIYLGDLLGLSAMDIYSIASFYTMFNLKPVGKYHICVCKTLSCMLNGSESLLSHLEQKLGISTNESSKDGLFTLSEVECLGNCGGAPCMSLNGEYFSNLNAEKLDEIIDGLEK